MAEEEIKREYGQSGEVLTFWFIFVGTKRNKNSSARGEHGISRVIEDILGCKWTVVVLRNIAAGTTRPGALTRKIPGLTAKVLNERLRKLLRYSIITREVFNELPPKVEYHLTPLGQRIAKVLSALEEIEVDLAKGEGASPIRRGMPPRTV